MGDYKQAYFETVWTVNKPSNKLPVEFEKKLKESVFTMLELVWNASCVTERNRIKAEFSDFVDNETPRYHPPTA
jgi:hypothetical protein